MVIDYDYVGFMSKDDISEHCNCNTIKGSHNILPLFFLFSVAASYLMTYWHY